MRGNTRYASKPMAAAAASRSQDQTPAPDPFYDLFDDADITPRSQRRSSIFDRVKTKNAERETARASAALAFANSVTPLRGTNNSDAAGGNDGDTTGSDSTAAEEGEDEDASSSESDSESNADTNGRRDGAVGIRYSDVVDKAMKQFGGRRRATAVKMNIDPALPTRARTASAPVSRAAYARQALARAEIGATLDVHATRKMKNEVTGKKEIVTRWFHAQLTAKPRTSDAANVIADGYMIAFDDEPGTSFNVLSDDLADVQIHGYHLRLIGNMGLPPAMSQVPRRGLALLRPADFVIYVGIDADNKGTECAAAIVVRKRREFMMDGQVYQNTWNSRQDLAIPPIPRADDETLGRVYSGGSAPALGAIAITAALRMVKRLAQQLEQERRQQQQQAPLLPDDSEPDPDAAPAIAIVVENSAFAAYKDLLSCRALPRRPQNGAYAPPASPFAARCDLNAALLEVANVVTIIASQYSVAATSAALQKRKDKPDIGVEAGCNALELELFSRYLWTYREKRLRMKQQQQDSCAMPVTNVNAHAQKIRTPQQFVDMCRRNRARDDVPVQLRANFANLVSAQLRAVNEALPNSEAKSTALVGLLLLPSAALPVGQRTTNIDKRLKQGRVYNMELSPAERKLQDNDDAAAAPAEDDVSAQEQRRRDAIARVHYTQEGKDMIDFLWQGGLDDSKEIRRRRVKVAAELEERINTEMDTMKAEERERAHVAAIATTAQRPQRVGYDRLAERVERLACEFKMRTARKMLFNVVEAQGKPDIPFEEKAALLRNKFVDCLDPITTDYEDLTFDLPETAPATREEVIATIGKMPAQAAACVDAWGKKLLQRCIEVLPGVADLVAQLAADMLNGKFDERAMAILRLGRAVGIPKDNGGIRPLQLTCFLCKLTGAIVMRRCNISRRRLDHQYAIGIADGTQHVVHRVRAEHENGMAIVRLDIANAFNSAKRKEVYEALLARKEHPDVIRYFAMTYGKSEKVAVYGPNGVTEYIDVVEGVRQGDSFSSYLFAVVIWIVTQELHARWPSVLVKFYADDGSLACPPRHALWVMHRAVELLEARGFKINIEKSSILTPPNCTARDLGAFPIPDTDAHRAWCEERQRAANAIIANDPTLHKFESMDALPHRDADGKRINVLYGSYEKNQDAQDAERDLEHEAADQRTRARMLRAWANFDVNLDEFHKRGAVMYNAADADTAAETECPAANQLRGKIKISTPDKSFVVLGANMTNAYKEFNDHMYARLTGFFDVLKTVGDSLHPQLSFTLARICGFVKARYYASVTPPEHSREVLRGFQLATIDFLERLFKFNILDQDFCHDAKGMGVPDYYNKADLFFREARSSTLCSLQSRQVPLVNYYGFDPAAHLSAQSSTEPWLFYQPRGYDTRMRDSEFRMAMAIRCGTLPTAIQRARPKSCRCGALIASPLAAIQHALCCKDTGYTPANRHTLLKCTVARVLQRYGIPVTIEPRFYEGVYPDGIRHRPDLTVWVADAEHVATDFVVVQHGAMKGSAAAVAANEKHRLHDVPVNSCGHIFVPFALEAHGHVDDRVSHFLELAGQDLPKHVYLEMRKDMSSAVSVALARARIQAVAAMLNQVKSHHDVFGDDHEHQQEVEARDLADCGDHAAAGAAGLSLLH